MQYCSVINTDFDTRNCAVYYFYLTATVIFFFLQGKKKGGGAWRLLEHKRGPQGRKLTTEPEHQQPQKITAKPRKAILTIVL